MTGTLKVLEYFDIISKQTIQDLHITESSGQTILNLWYLSNQKYVIKSCLFCSEFSRQQVVCFNGYATCF
jgi:hypothetical protein